MRTKNIIALAVASMLLSPVVMAKEIKRSDLFDSSLSVGYKTRDVGAGVSVAADWNFSDNIGVYAGFNRISEDALFKTDEQLDRYGIEPLTEDVFPRSFSLDSTYIEYGVSLRHTFYNSLETPFSIYVKAGTAAVKYDDVVFLTAEAANAGSGSTGDSNGSDEPDVDQMVALPLPDYDALKGTVGVKFFINNRTTFDVGYTQYDVEDKLRREDRTEQSVDVEVSYFPRKNFGVSFAYESADLTGESTYNIQATLRF